MTTFTNVALSNTFNEFRQAHNDVGNTLTTLTTNAQSTVSVYADSVTANSFSASVIIYQLQRKNHQSFF